MTISHPIGVDSDPAEVHDGTLVALALLPRARDPGGPAAVGSVGLELPGIGGPHDDAL